jgi:hypothetical protein
MSRTITQALLVVLTAAVLYIAWQVQRSDSPGPGRQGEVRMLSLEEAVENSRSSNVRSNAGISVESCKKAREGFLQGTEDTVPAAESPADIEAALQAILAQVGQEGDVEMHLTCLMHQVSTPAGDRAQSKSG